MTEPEFQSRPVSPGPPPTGGNGGNAPPGGGGGGGTVSAVVQQGQFPAIKQWLGSHKKTAHAIVVIQGILILAWATDPKFKDAVYYYWSKVPPHVHQLLTGLIVAGTIYFRSQKTDNVSQQQGADNES